MVEISLGQVEFGPDLEWNEASEDFKLEGGRIGFAQKKGNSGIEVKT